VDEVRDAAVPVVALASSTLCWNYRPAQMVLGGILLSEKRSIQAVWFSQLWPRATAPARPGRGFSVLANIHRLLVPPPIPGSRTRTARGAVSSPSC